MGYEERHFVGRERVVREIVQGVLADPPTSFSLVGSKLSGKSKLLGFLASEDGPLIGDAYASWRPYSFSDGSRVIPIRIDCSIPSAREDFLAFLLAEVTSVLQRDGAMPTGRGREAQKEGSNTVALLALMRQVADSGYRPVLLMDNFDRIFMALPHDTVNELRPLTFHAALVVASEQPLHDLDRSLAASPLFNVMTQVFIGLVEMEVARRWVEEQLETAPALLPATDSLLEITGNHPYLLRMIEDILVEVREMLPSHVEIGPEHLPLMQLRMAEHGRQLFETFWRRMQAPPQRVKPPVLMSLLQRMVRHPIQLANATREETSTLNWLINQGMVIYSAAGRTAGYEFFSPLFADFLAERLAPTTAPAQNSGAANGNAMMPHPRPAPMLEPAFLGGLTRIEANLLAYLQAHSSEVISPETLLAEVWKRPDATPRRVQEAVRRLRLELEAADPPVGSIENDRGRGYRFVPA
jgi:hypothetical protein